MGGVGVTFFCDTIGSLSRCYGGKMCGKDDVMNEIIRHLGEVERLYKSLEDDPNPRPVREEDDDQDDDPLPGEQEVNPNQ